MTPYSIVIRSQKEIMVVQRDPWILKIPGYFPVGRGPTFQSALSDLCNQFTPGPLKEGLCLLVEKHTDFVWGGLTFTPVEFEVFGEDSFPLWVEYSFEERIWVAWLEGHSHTCGRGSSPQLALDDWRAKILSNLKSRISAEESRLRSLVTQLERLESSWKT